MAPAAARSRARRTWLPIALASGLAATLLLAAGPALALRVVTWNITQYPQNGLAARQPQFRTVLAALSPDLMIVQELDDATGRDSLLNNVLNVIEPGEWSASGWVSLGSGEGGAIFYKSAKVTITMPSSIVTGGPRNVMVSLIKPVGYVAASSSFRLYSVHFKAGNPAFTPADSATRRTECTNLRNILNQALAGTNLVLGGDTNFYGDWEGGYLRLTGSQADNDGRLKDPFSLPGTWNQFPYRFYHSQCPCITGCQSFFSGGGLDDRFDFFMTSYGVQDGAGLDLVSLGPYGNDGAHYNDDVNGGGFNNAVGLTIATALHEASDHLPVLLVLQLPAKVAAASQLDFGRVITGAVVTRTLSVSNPAVAPADVLDYTLSAPAGFTAPGGGFTAAAGAAANDHAIGMSTASVGAKSGTLTVASDDPDSAAKSVKLSGTVLRHAVASLDSATVTLAGTIDFGDRTIGSFADTLVRAHNQAWDALQARLAVTGGVIGGGDGRFSIVGGFAPALLAGVGGTWNLHFDDGGATLDSTYDATLTLAAEDEAIPGAAPESTLTVTLRARPITGPVGVGPGRLPTALRFYAPRPNPLSSGVWFAFDLPHDARVDLAVYDLSGRRVANMVSDFTPAGHHEARWNASSDRGARVPAGLYFVRFATPGLARSARLIVLP